MTVTKMATKQVWLFQDESGYSFGIDLEKDRDEGWTGNVGIYSRARMVDAEGVIGDILIQAKQLVRMLETEVNKSKT